MIVRGGDVPLCLDTPLILGNGPAARDLVSLTCLALGLGQEEPVLVTTALSVRGEGSIDMALLDLRGERLGVHEVLLALPHHVGRCVDCLLVEAADGGHVRACGVLSAHSRAVSARQERQAHEYMRVKSSSGC